MTDYKQICRNLMAAIDAEAREHTLGFELLKAYAEADAALATPEDEMEGTVKSDSDLAAIRRALEQLPDHE